MLYMIVRKIKPEELKRTNELFAIAFEFEMDNTKTADEIYEKSFNNSKSRDDVYCLERWAAFEDDNMTMMSNFIATPFLIQFDGHHCKMVGIGGVATLPQYRRTGGIRACFEAALPSMYESSVDFSYLYPFSTAYYRKFGYEMCCERLRYRIRLSSIPFAQLDGSCYLLEQGHTMKNDIQDIYETWQNKYNMMVINEAYEYEWVNQVNPAKDQTFTYLYKARNGVPKGFMTFVKERQGFEQHLKCTRFFFKDAEGFQGLMNLAYTYSSDHLYITFEIPTDCDITLFLPEWSMGAGSCEIVHCGMVRVVNVMQVLKKARYIGNGSIIIEISDTIIPQNNNRFYVSFVDGKAITVCTTEEQADISLSISQFSRFIAGACDTKAITFLDSINTNTDYSTLARVFYKKPLLITQYF